MVKAVRGVDVREYGSGNIGATNVYRVMGLKMGLLVALADICKGMLGVLIINWLIINQEPVFLLLGGVFTIAGHNWSVFLKFEGGRGVATTCGVLIILVPPVLLIVFLLWLLIVITSRYVSVASLAAAFLLPPLLLVFNYPFSYFIFCLILSIFVIYRHLENIKRLLKGKENRLSWPPRKMEE